MAKAYNKIFPAKAGLLDGGQVLLMLVASIPGIVITFYGIAVFSWVTMLGLLILLVLPATVLLKTKKIRDEIFGGRAGWLSMYIRVIFVYNHKEIGGYNHNVKDSI